ncbi:MAG: stage II sporulation protein E, partial [Caldanaerobacter sp.]
ALKGRFSENVDKGFYKNILNSALFLVFAFILGRASVSYVLFPFGVAFFAAMVAYRKKYFFVSLGVILALITVPGINISKYILSMAVIFVLELFFRVKSSNVAKASFITFFSLFASGLVFSYSYNFLYFDVFLSLYEAIIAMLMVFVFNHALSFLVNRNARKLISNEELISLGIFTAVFILGLHNLSIWKFDLKNVVIIFTVLFISYLGGSGAGAAIGTTIGVLNVLAYAEMPSVIGVLAFGGLLGGSFRKLNKMGTITGFVIGAAIVMFYTGLKFDSGIGVNEMVLASLLFAVLPKTYIKEAEKLVKGNKNLNDRDYSRKLKEVVAVKLKEYSEVFEELSKTFKQSTDKIMDHKDISYLFEEIANRTCSQCVMYKNCWDRDFYSTYKAMFELVEHLEKGKDISENRLFRKCIRFSELMSNTKYYLGIYKISMQWRERLKDAKGLIAAQLEGVANAISDIAKEVNMNISFKDELEQAILLELDKNGIAVEDVLVYETEGESVVKVYKEEGYVSKDLERKISFLISEIMGERYEKKDKIYGIDYKGRCVLSFAKAESFQIITGISKVSKSKSRISGDTHSFMDLKNGKYVVALSDGMGIGYKAAEESATAISLLEKFIEAGFDKELVIQMLNSILALRSAEEMFSTIDIMFFDKFTGKAEFVKIGACVSYIKRGTSIEVIESSSLPVGILEDIEADLHEKELKEGDFVILVTDGVLECYEGDKERQLSKIISEANFISPQEMADYIMGKSLESCGNMPKDDMTVIVAKIWKRIYV